ncbi:MAG: fumarylacetoacetate hydrolase family protein [Candidatus Dormibacteria bacterium]
MLTGEILHSLPVASMAELLSLSAEEIRAVVEEPGPILSSRAEAALLAPVDRQEVWAAGVTYRRSRDARLEESGGADVYDRVYEAERPELFFKSAGWRVAGSGGGIAVRDDSEWDLPEAELALVVNAHGQIVGYTAGNDVSSRSIEGENALYLPQAKVYDGACALGPGVRPAWEVDEPVFEIKMKIERAGEILAEGHTNTADMKRGFQELADWLTRATAFPDGVILMTGTGIVPPADISLAPGDWVVIAIDGIGELVNKVGPRGQA